MSVRIFDQNFLESDFLAAFNPSSQQTAFPATNVLAFERRTKVWRTNGYWEFDDTNRTIVFQETASVDISASIAAGSYTSTEAVVAAIEAAMNAAGSSTYLVEIDSSTLKIKFTSNGAGGGGIFTINWPSSTMGSTLGFDDGAVDSGALSYTADVLKIHTGEYLEFDFGLPSNPHAFALTGARNSGIKISPTASIRLQGNETNTWTSPTYDAALTYDGSVIFDVNTAGLFGQNLRYARLSIVDPSNVNGYVEVGAVFLGDYFEGTRGKAQFPFTAEYLDSSRVVTSEGGQTFSDVRQQTEAFSINWFGLTVEEKESIDTLFASLGTGRPFFVQFDSNPNLGFSSRTQKYVRYVKFASAPSYALESPTNFSCQMSFREEL